MKRLIAIILAGALLAGCASNAPPGQIGANKTTGGALIGAGTGALIGSKFGSGSGKLVTTALGALLGGWLGAEAGASLDRADIAYAQQAQARAQAGPIGQTVTWTNPDTGNRGQITPIREGRNNYDGAYCREFQQTIYVGGQTQSGYGVACRQPDGSWRIVQ